LIGTATAPLFAATDPSTYGGKAAQLGTAISQGLPVPSGFALDWQLADRVAAGDDAACSVVAAALGGHGGPWAVRSSAVGEDSSDASFAGTHVSVLGMVGVNAVLGAVRQVHASARDHAAVAYRTQLGIDLTARMGVVVQEMVDADVAGVMFTNNPVTGTQERLVEATWGLGEAVVSGMVTPDQYRMTTDGLVVERTPGEKDLAIRLRPDGGVREVSVDPELVNICCLTDAQLADLHGLALDCDRAFGDDRHDIEFAFSSGRLFLLQRRPITHG
jgi:pyruvate, water dikinase